MRKFMLVIGIAVSLLVIGLAYRYYLVVELRKPVLADLTDPDSAIFRNERIAGNWLPSGSMLCNEVNAKNRMGGYVGYVPFTSWGGKLADIGSNESMAEVVKAQCEDV